ncbi:MAG: BBP7 family outer membrane beta-barrel protein [Planctomycetales bacterium]|nr:BBP7 family outer membrane beta-barrel protein [Planctomycetales bacterium]
MRRFWGDFQRIAQACLWSAVAAFWGTTCFANETNCGSSVECGDTICGAMNDCCCEIGPRAWFSAEYLLWQVSGVDVPALVTSSPAGTPLNQAGRLDDPSTTVLAGNDTILDGWRSGYALSGGVALDPCGRVAIIGDYFNAGRDSYRYGAGPDTGAIIARPFYNTQAGAQDVELVDVPNELSGRVDITGHTDFQGAGAALMANLWNCCDSCSDRSSGLWVLGGYRYYQHDSRLNIVENLLVLPGTTTPLVPGTSILLSDQFTARNVFHGGEFGLQGRVQREEWWIDGLAAIAVGNNTRTVTVSGSTTNTVPGVGTSTAAGGLLTSSVTNIGRYEDSKTTVIPRFRLGAGVQLTEHLAARVGYNVIIWDDVAQAAAHLPPGLAVDPRNLPPVQAGGGPDPAFPGIQSSTVVAHGFDFGLLVDF